MGLVIMDAKLKKSVDNFFEELKKYYPEHKVFALDSINKGLRNKLSTLYKEAGCKTAEEFLSVYGYQIISGEDVRKLRSFVIYTPGNEPDIIKGKVDSMISQLNEYYPNRKIFEGLQSEHKSLSNIVSGLYQWLGYSNAEEMLSAYGFEKQCNNGGRPKNDYQGLISLLQEKYKDKEKATSLGLLIHDNSEYASQLKTLNNKSTEIFGMSLGKYFREIGLIVGYSKKSKTAEVSQAVVTKKISTYHYFTALIEETESLVYCATDTRTIHEGNYVEMCKLHDKKKLIGEVKEAFYHILEEELPCPLEEMYQFIRKVTKTELREREASKLKYLFCSVMLQGRSDTLYYISPFEDIEVGDLVQVDHSWYGNTTGVVTKIELCSEKTAPFSVKRTKPIIETARHLKHIKEQATARFDVLIQTEKNKTFTKQPIDADIIEKYEGAAYFSGAVFRGLEIDVRNAVEKIYSTEFNPFTHAEEIIDGIYQFECDSAHVPQIVEEYPNLKAIFFAEDWDTASVYLAFSESGYSTVTKMRHIGECDFFTRDRWSLIHDPTEDFCFYNIKYEFVEKALWESYNYVLPNGDLQLVKETIVPLKPYKKRTTKDPSEIIKIIFPESEKS